MANPIPKPEVKQLNSILTKEFRGVMFLTGHRGVGKSFLAAQADAPENILFLDFEEKGAGIDAMLNFGRYESITSIAAKEHGAMYKPSQLFEVIKNVTNDIEPNKYTVAVLDNIQPFEEAMLAAVKLNSVSFGIDPKNAASGAYGGAWPAVNGLVSGFCNKLYSKGIRLVIAIAHMKQPWSSSGPIPNKWKPKGVERWHELSILSLVLIPGDFPPIPSALVQKEQLGLLAYDPEKGEHTIQRRMPLRLSKATFAEIRRYLKEPADLAKPMEGEVPTNEETKPYSDKFDREQLEYLKVAAQAALVEQKEKP